VRQLLLIVPGRILSGIIFLSWPVSFLLWPVSDRATPWTGGRKGDAALFQLDAFNRRVRRTADPDGDGGQSATTTFSIYDGQQVQHFSFRTDLLPTSRASVRRVLGTQPEKTDRQAIACASESSPGTLAGGGESAGATQQRAYIARAASLGVSVHKATKNRMISRPQPGTSPANAWKWGQAPPLARGVSWLSP